MIQILPPQVANLIAAGEVVERPAAAIKELIENAVDAGAAAIAVESRDGGVSYLRVTDNGAGMSLEDARSCFLRHATSKIRTAEDLTAIGTLGFRGEALAAISSVSRIDCFTRQKAAATGVLLTVEAGTVVDEREAGCPEGTSMVIRDLFFNTPARMKFLKKDSTESGHIHTAVLRAALSRPEVSFRLIQDGREVLNTPGDGKLLSCLYAVYGRDFALGMAEARASLEDVAAFGYVLKPEAAKASRQWQHFIVCGRPVASRLLMAALEEAYASILPAGRFPGCALHVTLPLNAFDINVHPAKNEVRFARERAVFDAVNLAARGALASGSISQMRAPVLPVAAMPPPAGAPVVIPPVTRTYALHPALADPPREKHPPPVGGRGRPPLQTAPEFVYDSPKPVPAGKDWRCIGEALGAFILVEQEGELLFIDKHAAHERILFNRLLDASGRSGVPSQLLLEPCSVRLAGESAAALLNETELLSHMGFCIEDFGGGNVLVREAPAGLDAEELPVMLEELSEQLISGRGKPVAERTRALLHTIACKAAVKAGRTGSPEEAQTLAAAVLSDPELRRCPHGRPLVLGLGKSELYNRFLR